MLVPGPLEGRIPEIQFCRILFGPSGGLLGCLPPAHHVVVASSNPWADPKCRSTSGFIIYTIGE